MLHLSMNRPCDGPHQYQIWPMTQHQCPNCGSPAQPAFDAVKMMSCEACGTTLFLSDAQTRAAGEQGVMHEVPMLFGLGNQVRIGFETYQIVGHARYSYGRGTWDEFCTVDGYGNTHWISVDEGDIIVQRELHSPKDWPRYDGYLKLGTVLDHKKETFTVVEDGSAECVAVRGSFDHVLTVGQRYRFVNLQGNQGRLLSGEFEGDSRTWYMGQWHDPFDVEVIA